MPKSLINLWPSSKNCRECLTTEAESASSAVFLAVHHPMSLYRRLFSDTGQNAKLVKEADLLTAFLSDDIPSGTLLLPVVGSSGVGKSHMIRWLDAHIRGRQDRIRRHIVRIPKSASLKVVLSLILDDLRRDSEVYQVLHEELSSASMPKQLDDATYGLLSKLIVALERNYKEAETRLKNHNQRVDDNKRKTHCHPSCLPSLLGDPALKTHFTAHDKSGKLGVLARIALRYIHGDSAEYGPQNVFNEEDLKFGESFKLQEVSSPVRIYLNVLKQRNGEHLKDAVSFLNEVVDNALGELLDFGANSLTDLFVRIREQLLIDDIELVLLIEDFAALAGIQHSLLDAVIREGVRDGKKVLCTMRTAFAVTEGYLSSSDTVKTRAQYEWKISDYPFSNEEEALSTYSNFVGRYLNAARWGKSVVENKLTQNNNSPMEDWLPDYYQEIREELTEDDNETLAAFDYSEGGNSLFPFNPSVLRQLIRTYFKKGEKFIFNPRTLINSVLHETLVNYRRDFEKGVFPPPKFHDFNRNQAEQHVNDEIKRKFPPLERTRAEAFVFFWGDNPQTLGQAASINPILFQCFKLSVIDWSTRPETREVTSKVKNKTPNVNSSTPTQSPVEERVRKMKRTIDGWRRDSVLNSKDADTIRGYLADAIREYVDWNSLLIEKPMLNKGKIFLPNVSINNPKDEDAIAFAGYNEDLDLPDSSDKFFGGMYALVRYHEYKSWDYEGSENDYSLYLNLIERMSTQAKKYYLNEAHGLPDRKAVDSIAQSLLIGARILNIEGGSANTDSDNIASIYTQEIELTDIPKGKWGQLVLSTSNIRKDLIELLTKFTAARQGDSKDRVLAVDAAFLLRIVRGNRKLWRLSSDFNLRFFRNFQKIREYFRVLKGSIDKSIEERQIYLSSWISELDNWLGENFDVQRMQSDFLNLLSLTRKEQNFVCREYQYEQMRMMVRSLGECKIKENVSLISTALESNDPGKQLSSLSKVDDQTIQTTRKVFSSYEGFLTQTTVKIDERFATVPPSVDVIAKKCLDHIDSINSVLNKLEGENS